MRTLIGVAVLSVFLGLTGRAAIAADCSGEGTCCDRCGCHAACVQKVCQVVCEMKKETKTCWNVECQEVCPLMPGCRCGSCDCKCPPPPRCGNPKCVKKLVKKEYQVEKPVYRCVVKNLCADCCGGGSGGAVVPTSAPKMQVKPAPAIPPAPANPVPAGKLK